MTGMTVLFFVNPDSQGIILQTTAPLTNGLSRWDLESPRQTIIRTEQNTKKHSSLHISSSSFPEEETGLWDVGDISPISGMLWATGHLCGQTQSASLSVQSTRIPQKSWTIVTVIFCLSASEHPMTQAEPPRLAGEVAGRGVPTTGWCCFSSWWCYGKGQTIWSPKCLLWQVPTWTLQSE